MVCKCAPRGNSLWEVGVAGGRPQEYHHCPLPQQRLQLRPLQQQPHAREAPVDVQGGQRLLWLCLEIGGGVRWGLGGACPGGQRGPCWVRRPPFAALAAAVAAGPAMSQCPQRAHGHDASPPPSAASALQTWHPAG
eukprot:1161453-Pelagomonas_calceolata.AAC.4